MLKHVYKIIFLAAVFFASFYFFSRNIHEAAIETKKSTTVMGDSTFPIIYIENQKTIMNTLHGYSSNIDTREVRESITALTQNKTFTLHLSEPESKIKKIEYELRSIRENKLLDNNSFTAFDKKKNSRTLTITLDATLDTSTEYGLKFTVTTNSSKKIHYYTRIKYYESDFYMKEKLEFINTFQTNTFTKEHPKKITTYIEPSSSEDNTSFSHVTINSSYESITWGDMKPTMITECIPTIKEINVETAAVQFDYYIEADTPTARERFHVKEYYRVRYSDGQFYLLYYTRDAEAVFNPSLTSVSESEFKLGITNETDMPLVMNDKNNKLAFVRDGSLWYYDLASNELTNVFTFLEKKDDFINASYDQHDIRILKMDENGNLHFIVYGYMNRGDYEGRVAILLYHYDAAKHITEERVYIPLTTTYAKLKQDFGKFSYVNDKDIFYFSLNNIVYSYNMTSEKCHIMADNISDGNFAMLEESKCFAWMDNRDVTKSKSVTIFNLESEEKITVTAEDKDNIAILGTIEDNIIIGYVHNDDISESKDGSILTPYYRLNILNSAGDILKDYQEKNRYIKSIKVTDNILHLYRLKKSGSSFSNTSEDSILNNIIEDTSKAKLSTRVTDLAMTEYYISMPPGFKMEALPKNNSTRTVVITQDTTLHLHDNTDSQNKYYIYAYGTITDACTDVASAITLADKEMGVVLDNNSNLVWERGGKFLSKSISGIEPAYVETDVTSIGACIQMLLQTNQITVKASAVSSNKSMTKILSKHIDIPVNLTGCTLDQVLYFVSSSNPVIAMKNSSEAVLITGYTETSVTYIDPGAMMTYNVSLTNANNMFEDAGNVFVSFIR